MDRTWDDRKSAYALDWFRRVFPYLSSEPREKVSPQAQASAMGNEGPMETSAKEPEPKPEKEARGLEIHERDVITVPCPRCRKMQMLEMRGEIDATHIPPNPEGERRTEVADSVSRVNCTCS